MAEKWSLKAHLIGACSCDWGCPCSFDARPTQGFCEGGYTWNVTSGSFGTTKLDGVTFIVVGHSPGPLHEGNVVWAQIIDQRANVAQREAIAALLSGKHGGPWEIFGAIAIKILGPFFANIEFTAAGITSKVKADDIYQAELGPILNPVTGTPEELRLLKPTGFTSKWADLASATVSRLSVPGVAYDHPAKYGEYAEFDYTSPK